MRTPSPLTAILHALCAVKEAYQGRQLFGQQQVGIDCVLADLENLEAEVRERRHSRYDRAYLRQVPQQDDAVQRQ